MDIKVIGLRFYGVIASGGIDYYNVWGKLRIISIIFFYKALKFTLSWLSCPMYASPSVNTVDNLTVCDYLAQKRAC